MMWEWCAPAVFLLTFAGLVSAEEPRSTPPAISTAKGPVKTLSAELLLAKLDERVDVQETWTGTLEQALEHLRPQLGIPIVVDNLSFGNADPPLQDVEGSQVRIERIRQQPYRVLFERMLKSVDGVLLVREEHYEVVSRQIASRAADPDYAPEDHGNWFGPTGFPIRPTYPFISIVNVLGEKRVLADVLRELATTAGENIVITPQAGDKAKTPITARMLNVRFEIALKTLAEIVDLQVVKRGNIWLVTSKSHATVLNPPIPPSKPRERANPVRHTPPKPHTDIATLLHDLVVLQIMEQQRRLTIAEPDQRVKDHDRLQKLEETVRELTERDKARRIITKQQPGASPFDPDPNVPAKRP